MKELKLEGEFYVGIGEDNSVALSTLSKDMNKSLKESRKLVAETGKMMDTKKVKLIIKIIE